MKKDKQKIQSHCVCRFSFFLEKELFKESMDCLIKEDSFSMAFSLIEFNLTKLASLLTYEKVPLFIKLLLLYRMSLSSRGLKGWILGQLISFDIKYFLGEEEFE